MRHRSATMSIERLKIDYNSKILIIDDSYQREYVWNDAEVKSELIRSMINLFPIGTFIFWDKRTENNPRDIDEIIDGQQRLKTIFNFMEGKFTIRKDITKKIIHDNKKSLIIESENGDTKSRNLIDNKIERISFNSLPEFLKRKVSIYNASIIYVSNTNKLEVKEYFSVVQNQEKLKAGELIHSLPNNIVKKYFDNDTLKKMSEVLNFNNDRKDILKQLNMLVGLNIEKLRMGAVDKEILKQAKQYDESSINDKMNNIFQNILYDFSEQNTKLQKIYNRKFPVFGLKLLLLSYLFKCNEFVNMNIYKKRDFIQKITEMCGKFNSNDLSKKEVISKEIYEDIQQI